MNATELAQYINRMGGLRSGAAFHLQPSAILDPDLRAAWRYMRLHWQRFEQELAGFEAILDGKLGLRTSSV